ncbi:hypothetical protein [Streptomyces sp. NRRL F-2580]|uniref:hypothetical protein n=1 Tax=Streptomyces sp. NRRL F-2580 TaxID=1463841 RepID=UPI000AE06BAD|nr:hypothetical protein [Streptomyces sp. NRRL F-2580]
MYQKSGNVTDSAAVTCGKHVSAEAREDACARDRRRAAKEKRPGRAHPVNDHPVW